MKMIMRFLLVICLLSLLSTDSPCQLFVWDNPTNNDVITLVRAFENQPNMAVTVAGPYYVDSSQPSSYATDGMYKLNAGNYEYRVSAATRYVFTRTNTLLGLGDEYKPSKSTFYGQPYNLAVLASQAMSQQSAEILAWNFVSTHHPNPLVLSLGNTNAHYAFDENGHPSTFLDYYQIEFNQECGNGIQGPTRCLVYIDSVLGVPIYYCHESYPILIPLTPLLTGNQAMDAAISVLLNGNGTRVSAGPPYVSSPDVLGQECLLYQVYIKGTDGDQNGLLYVAYVNAINGTIVAHDAMQSMSNEVSNVTKPSLKIKIPVSNPLNVCVNGSSVSLVHPAYLIDNQPYIWVGYLAAGKQSKLIWLATRKMAKTINNGRLLIFNVGRKYYTEDGTRKPLATVPRIVNSLCYVPLNAVRTYLPYKITISFNKRQINMATVKHAMR